MKENTFNMSRFQLVVKKDFCENYKNNILRFVSLFGGILTFEMISGYNIYRSGVQDTNAQNILIYGPLFFIFFTIFLGFNASQMMNGMKTKSMRISYLMSPGSSFEKYIWRWFYVTIISAVLFFIAYFAADSIRIITFKQFFPNYEFHYYNMVESAKNMFDAHYGILILGILLIQSFFTLGSTIWYKNPALKTAISGIALIALFSILLNALGEIFINDGNSYVFNGINADTFRLIIQIKMAILTLAFWTIGYYRFKESEIIHRF